MMLKRIQIDFKLNKFFLRQRCKSFRPHSPFCYTWWASFHQDTWGMAGTWSTPFPKLLQIKAMKPHHSWRAFVESNILHLIKTIDWTLSPTFREGHAWLIALDLTNLDSWQVLYWKTPYVHPSVSGYTFKRIREGKEAKWASLYT